MQVKTYRGKSAEECFQKVKGDLGRDAVILQARTFHPYFGRFGKLIHEIVAASDVTLASDRLNRSTEGSPRKSFALSSGRGARAAVATREPVPAARAATSGGSVPRESFPREPVLREPSPRETAPIVDARIEQLEKQLSTLTASVQGLATQHQARPSLFRAAVKEEPVDPYAFLVKQLQDVEVADPVIQRLIGQLPTGLSASEAASELRTVIAKDLKIAGKIEVTPGKMRLVAFFGATGVGKTTTIAKIAAQLALTEKQRIGIISMDTYRVAAAQQLQTYGEIMRVPVKVAYNRQELVQYLSEFLVDKRDLVMLDTAGRSPSEAAPLAELAETFKGINGVTRYLAVPATLSGRNFDNTIERFHALMAPDALIMTKLDESIDNACLGHLLNAQAKYAIPISYITNGQRVPDDLMTADAHAVAARLLSTTVM